MATGTLENVRGGSIFRMGGVTFGLEVCLDHLNGRLNSATDKNLVQIQLIPSAGAFIEPTNVVAGAVAFNVDGGGSDGDSAVYDSRRSDKEVPFDQWVAGPVTLGYFRKQGYVLRYPTVAIP
jgi:hypothetical protein